ncbi:MAG: STAS domain-containing protein [Phycisphaerales bacterium]|nr:STAS domain-containing protein [Phycisphaerales bacterium]
MTIQNWSDNVLLGELQDDPVLSDDLTALVEQVRERGDQDVVLDFTNVGYVNSSNIAKLLKLRKIVNISHHRKMVLCGINSQVWGVFLITGLEKLFEFADNVSLALATIQIKNNR